MDLSDLIDHYCQAWTEPNAARRAGLLASVWAASATYTDPSVHAASAEALLAHIAKVQAVRPGSRVQGPAFQPRGRASRHRQVRVAWRSSGRSHSTGRARPRLCLA